MPRIFKAGNYGKKGNYSTDTLKTWIGKEFNITAGHVGDWIKNGYPLTAIPVAGSCKVTDVDNDGFLIGEFDYNSFGDSIKEQYPNLSIGIGEDGPDHLALLGYAPPHLKDLDRSFSEFSQDLTSIEKTETIEFSENSLLEDVLNLDAETQLQIACNIIDKLDATEANITGLSTLVEKIWDKQDLSLFIEKLQSQGYTVEKTAEFSENTLKTIAEAMGMTVSVKPVDNMTPAEIYSKAKAEFTREAEREETKKKVISMFPPVLHSLLEFAVDKAFEEQEYTKVIEFSETEKSTMADKLKEFSKGESPFKHLFKNITKNAEFSETSTEITDSEKRIGGYYE